jgi:hypothetical protein
METPEYLHLKPGHALPLLDGALFKAVIVIDAEVTPEWRAKTSEWLVRSGCRYMMAWGLRCSDWDDSVDLANLAMFDFGEVSDDNFVMTTWHVKGALLEVFWFSEHAAFHPSLALERTLIIHISTENKGTELVGMFRAAQVNPD